MDSMLNYLKDIKYDTKVKVEEKLLYEGESKSKHEKKKK